MHRVVSVPRLHSTQSIRHFVNIIISSIDSSSPSSTSSFDRWPSPLVNMTTLASVFDASRILNVLQLAPTIAKYPSMQKSWCNWKMKGNDVYLLNGMAMLHWLAWYDGWLRSIRVERHRLNVDDEHGHSSFIRSRRSIVSWIGSRRSIVSWIDMDNHHGLDANRRMTLDKIVGLFDVHAYIQR